MAHVRTRKSGARRQGGGGRGSDWVAAVPGRESQGGVIEGAPRPQDARRQVQLLRGAYLPSACEVIEVIKAGDESIEVGLFRIINVGRRAIEGRSDVDVGVNHCCSPKLLPPETGLPGSKGDSKADPWRFVTN
jgi:hypothetical protein